MQDLDVAIDDYLHTIVRSQPWIKKQEEAALLAFSEWLYDQQLSRALTTVGPELTARYATVAGLSVADHEALDRALGHVFAWAQYQHEVTANPFLAAISA
ncbi:MAG TPA: hypothetical protein VGD69_06565 [Herpetosiphonaceae bacterium]